MDNEDQRITPRIVIEYCFHWRVRQDSTIPIKISVDADGGKCWRQRARRNYMFSVELRVAAVEVPHFPGPHICRPYRQADGVALDPREIHQFVQCPLERFRGVERGRTGAQRDVGTSEGKWIGLEKAWNAPHNRESVGDQPAEHGRWRNYLMERSLLDTVPEFPQA
jgi:hypothetical protein